MYIAEGSARLESNLEGYEDYHKFSYQTRGVERGGKRVRKVKIGFTSKTKEKSEQRLKTVKRLGIIPKDSDVQVVPVTPSDIRDMYDEGPIKRKIEFNFAEIPTIDAIAEQINTKIVTPKRVLAGATVRIWNVLIDRQPRGHYQARSDQIAQWSFTTTEGWQEEPRDFSYRIESGIKIPLINVVTSSEEYGRGTAL